MQSQRPELRHRDSWENYSTDEDEPQLLKPEFTAAAPPTNGAANYDSVPSFLRPGGGPRPPAHNVESNNNTTQIDGAADAPPTRRPDEIPSALRVGGGVRKETNPFLRNKLPDNPMTNMQPPTESLANMGMGESESNPWNPPPQPEKKPTGSSSVYSQPSVNAHDGSDGWVVDPKRPPIPTITPASATADSPRDYQQSYMQSPLELQENPWSSNTTAMPVPSPPQPLKPTSTGSTNPFLNSNTQTPAQQPSPAPIISDNDPFGPPGNNAYSNISTPPQLPPIHSPALMSVPSDDDVDASVGALDKGKAPASGPPVPPQVPSNPYPDDDNIWDDLGAVDKGKGKAVDPTPSRDPAPGDDWNLIDVEPSVGTAVPQQSTSQAAQSSVQPTLPPRQSGEAARWTSPRPPVDSKAETYEVKKIRWHDVESSENPRTSPILVQNENGPCPLVALVNALSLTTPANADDASLVGMLRTREQISLNLLLEAVFEELMSPRRTSGDVALPDVGELYAFLQSLHTGMNVNPRYIPSDMVREVFKHSDLTHLSATERDQYVPGTFENTHEMGLYFTFKIPLIHGWLPENSDPTYEALERQAPSYEDAQNLLFREEELENKLSSSNGLTMDEQQLYQDLFTIKQFLTESATQLTAWGIQVIAKAMKPGSFAILFRNDHFSTVYCHPQTKQLVTLVTDYGYRTHEEVIWESLVDINGERTQYLSGDFRVVGSSGSTSFGGYSQQGGGEWTTVDNSRGRGRQPAQTPQQGQQPGTQTTEAPLSAAEQEDRDLALAMQLQEEEDQRHREEVARRQREQDLSNRVIEQQGRQPYLRQPSSTSQTSGIAPARRSSQNPAASSPAAGVAAINTSNTHLSPNQQPPPQPARPTSQQVRPLIPPRRNVPPLRPEEGGEAPPTYEQARNDEPYNPPPGHPNHASSSPAMSRVSTAASARNPAGLSAAQLAARGQRAPGQNAAQGMRPGNGSGRDRDCIVM